MKLAIDVMGFENDISHVIDACKKFNKSHREVEFLLVGKKELIEEKIKTNKNFSIIDAREIIKMDENPLMALRNSNSSMYQAIDLVAQNKADGVLSAGSTACYVAIVFHLLKKINTIKKVGFMPFIPTVVGNGFNLIDVGANKECSGEDLYKFAVMSSIYCKSTRNIVNPRVGVINIGTEEGKGFEYQNTANQLLKSDKSINYVGFIEPRELLNGIVDVAICDGYTGNITLKAMEGGLKSLKTALKSQYKKP
jgi:glycerol-3-phosphate acyltransferase PlsX